MSQIIYLQQGATSVADITISTMNAKERKPVPTVPANTK